MKVQAQLLLERDADYPEQVGLSSLRTYEVNVAVFGEVTGDLKKPVLVQTAADQYGNVLQLDAQEEAKAAAALVVEWLRLHELELVCDDSACSNCLQLQEDLAR